MDNVYFLLIGAALTAAGIVAFRQGERVAVRAIAAAGFTAGGIMFFVLLPLLDSLRVASCSSLLWLTHYPELDNV